MRSINHTHGRKETPVEISCLVGQGGARETIL